MGYTILMSLLIPSCTYYPLFLAGTSGVASASMSGSEYVHIFTPEETVLENFFVMLSKFNFDRAKDQCVSEW